MNPSAHSPPDDSPELVCSTHPDAIAGWRCHGDCKKLLCPACSAQLLTAFTCCGCGGPAHRTSIARKSKSYTQWLATALASPFTKGLPVFLLFVMLMGAVPFITGIIEASPGQLSSITTAVQLGVAALYLLLCVDAGSRGSTPEPGAGIRLARYIVSLIWVWVPAGAFLYFIGAPTSHDWMLWLLAGLALTYIPIALEVAAMDISFGDALDPFKMFELAWRLGRTYIGTIIVVAILGGAAAAVAGPALKSINATVHAPFVKDALGALPSVALLAMAGYVIGLVTYVHGDTMGWGSAAGYREPIFPKMVATGRRKIERSQELPTESGQVPTTSGAVQNKLSPAERALVAKLADAIKTDNLARALRMYEEREWPAGAVDDRMLIALSRGAARAKKQDLAQKLLEEAYARDGRLAGQALLALGQLFAANGNASRAQDTYKRVVERYPDTDVAKVAAKSLGAA